MPLTFIDVLDSAVKIGLGAVIAAVVSVITMKATHSNERNKDFRAHQIRTLELIADKYDAFINAMDDYNSLILGRLENRKPEEEFKIPAYEMEIYKAADEKLMVALKNARSAHIRLSLIKGERAQEQLTNLFNLLADYRNPIALNDTYPSKATAQKFRVAKKEVIKELHNELSKLFDSFA